MFPPDPTLKRGFYPSEIYMEAIKRYPSIVHLIREKAKENGEKTWMIYEDGRTLSYLQIDQLTSSFAAGLKSLGIKNNDKVAIFAPNSPEWIIGYFGILKAGGIPVTVNTMFVKDPLVYNLTRSDSTYLIIDSKLLNAYLEVESKLPKIKYVITIGDEIDYKGKKEHVNFNDLLNSKADIKNEANPKPYETSAMILTSGTTGPSKVVAETHAQFIYTALVMIDAGGITPQSKVYVYLPLYHIMALDLATISSMLANSTMVLVERLYASRFWEDIVKYGITHFHAVGPIFDILLKQPETRFEKEHRPIVALAYSSRHIWVEAVKRFGIYISGGYGSTEAGIPVTNPYDEVISRKVPPGACGRPTPPFDVIVANDEGFPLPPGQAGEILIRPKLPWAIFKEYYNMPDKTVEAFRGLWFHTGDLGVFDENGYLYFVDRLKDAIRRRGENISSYEVEQILLKHPKIAEVAVIPAPSEVGEDEVMAVIVPKGERLSPEEIIDYAIENMPKFWVPRYVRFTNSLPRTATGRVEKYKLREQGITEDTVDMANYIKLKLKERK